MYSMTTAVGRITKDPQFKAYSSGNGELALFSIAINRGKDNTDFYDCVAFGKTAEMVKSYLSNGKGRMILVEGVFQNNNTKRKIEGIEVTNYGMNLVVNTIKFLDAPPKSTGTAPQQSQAQAPAQQQRPAYNQPTTSPSFQNTPPQQNTYQQQPSTASTPDPFTTTPGFNGFDIADDDLPF